MVANGWVVDVPADQVDARRLEQFVDDAASLTEDGQLPAARDHLEEAVALWGGPPFAERLADDQPLSAAARPEEKDVAACQQLLRLRLDTGEPHAVADAQQLVAAYPLRERLWALLMEAQCRGGQSADYAGDLSAAT